jgi:hypothetical protein
MARDITARPAAGSFLAPTTGRVAHGIRQWWPGDCHGCGWSHLFPQPHVAQFHGSKRPRAERASWSIDQQFSAIVPSYHGIGSSGCNAIRSSGHRDRRPHRLADPKRFTFTFTVDSGPDTNTKRGSQLALQPLV